MEKQIDIDKVQMEPDGLRFFLAGPKAKLGIVPPLPGKVVTARWRSDIRLQFWKTPPPGQEYYPIAQPSFWYGHYIITNMENFWRSHGINLWRLVELVKQSSENTRLQPRWETPEVLLLSVPEPLKEAIMRY